MPDLPTVTVTQPQADRILAAFGSVAEYKMWLKKSVRDRVISFECRVMADLAANQQNARAQEIVAALPDPATP